MFVAINIIITFYAINVVGENAISHGGMVPEARSCRREKIPWFCEYRSGTLNSNTVNSKLDLYVVTLIPHSPVAVS